MNPFSTTYLGLLILNIYVTSKYLHIISRKYLYITSNIFFPSFTKIIKQKQAINLSQKYFHLYDDTFYYNNQKGASNKSESEIFSFV